MTTMTNDGASVIRTMTFQFSTPRSQPFGPKAFRLIVDARHMFGVTSFTATKRLWIGTLEATLDYAIRNAAWYPNGVVIMCRGTKHPVGGLF